MSDLLYRQGYVKEAHMAWLIHEALTPEQLQMLKTWHDRLAFGCTAANEGQLCCIDFLLDEDEPAKEL